MRKKKNLPKINDQSLRYFIDIRQFQQLCTTQICTLQPICLHIFDDFGEKKNKEKNKAMFSSFSAS